MADVDDHGPRWDFTRPAAELSVPEAVFEALGAASTCTIPPAGRFDSERALAIGERLLGFLASRGLDVAVTNRPAADDHDRPPADVVELNTRRRPTPRLELADHSSDDGDGAA